MRWNSAASSAGEGGTPGMRLGGRDDLQAEVLGEIRPTVVHDHDLRAAKGARAFFQSSIFLSAHR